jgi:putative endonuclease
MDTDRPTVRLGRDGEAAALEWYRRQGYTLVARNWRCSIGELDLIMTRGGELVICEVKARRGDAFGGPYEAVTARKQHKLARLAELFLASTDARPSSVRFDVASVVTKRGSASMSVHVFEHAFQTA